MTTRMMAKRPKKRPKKNRSNPSAATTFSKKFRNARSGRAVSTRSRKSSSGAR
jgi:hypothetical protein